VSEVGVPSRGAHMLLSATGLEKSYEAGEAPVHAVRGVDLSLAPGEFVALMGPSGCGKSTLLHLCGAMDRPTRGAVAFEGRDLATLDDDRLTRVRRERIGFVFQFFNLLPTLTVEENIALPLRLAGRGAGEAVGRAREAAGRVGLSHRLGHYPQQLSGGELQRTAIARAVVHRPALLVADEPTGNLDSTNGARVMELLVSLHTETRVAVLLATHAPEVAAAAHRILHMRDGRIARVEPRADDGTPGGSSRAAL
jgi:putative ABC transport system ATP-binding protein